MFVFCSNIRLISSLAAVVVLVILGVSIYFFIKKIRHSASEKQEATSK